MANTERRPGREVLRKTAPDSCDLLVKRAMKGGVLFTPDDEPPSRQVGGGDGRNTGVVRRWRDLGEQNAFPSGLGSRGRLGKRLRDLTARDMKPGK